MKRLLLLLLILLNVLSYSAMAQNRTISGRVVSTEDGTALPGVSVVVKGTTIGASTDVEGRYSISVTGSPTLVFTFIGFTPREEAVGNRSTIDVRLATDAKAIEEIVVTGYTTQNRREVTGSVATVKAEEVALVPLASFDQALQGKSPGILVQANSGQPGAAANILIRGRGSILGSNDPLFVLDGIEISAGDFSTLNPADFESFSILKDASATSIYGSRGANGVVVITSKKGLAGKARFEYNVQYGFSKAPESGLELMNSNQKLDYEISRGNPYDWTDEDLARLRQINTDWGDVFFQTGRTANHTLSASGGSDKTTYFISGSVFDQTGTVRNTGLQRYTGRANVESVAGPLTFGLNSTFGYSELMNTNESDTGIGTPLNAINWTNPYETPYDENGEYTVITSGQPNALQELLENSNKRQQLKGVGNVYLAYAVPFLQGLTLRTSWGGDFRAEESAIFTNPTTYTGSFATGGSGSYGRGYERGFRYTGTTSATYSTQFATDHSLTVGLFNEVVRNIGRTFEFTGYGLGGPFQNEAGITPGNASNGFIPSVGGNGGENALLSYFTTVAYGFKDRYFVNVGLRRDGSSRFGENRKYANFGSVGLSWMVSDEPFMEGLSNVISDLKFKISYGTAGNQAGITDFQSRELYGRGIYSGGFGLTQQQLANPELQWEKKATFNTGIELSTLGGRLRSTAEFYNSITSELFLNRQLSRTTGFTSLTSNIGKLQNRGVELSLQGDVISSKNVNWSVNVSLTYNQNTVKELVEKEGEDDIVTGILINREGESMNSLFLVPFVGVNPANGNAQYRKLNGELTETYSAADRVIVGSAEVPFFGGFGSSLNIKGVELSAFFSFQRGNEVFNNDLVNVTNPAYFYDNMSVELLKEWKKAGDITDVPRAGNRFQSSTTRFVEDGNFLRLRNLNLSYTLPGSLTNTLRLRSVRAFVQGQNLVTWTDFRGWDPEITGASLVGAQYPALRTITFGLNIGL
ncbi:SusC/RagA family TonB-linked outer membrane protein [Rufibacter tibetensis]|uniref:SusC/RagA family TonB-linked outer membrane protein n=1 Tax=Rufibacter tibetensis TaxID=512763 RepID=A0A0P0CUE8_9BACT|nr:TonB-dependent receptor [Rufibacter tibetensis]ALI97977.1 SusC/RagA family TonB-linked outer membrane protein [Rufibacter tibetensis]